MKIANVISSVSSEESPLRNLIKDALNNKDNDLPFSTRSLEEWISWRDQLLLLIKGFDEGEQFQFCKILSGFLDEKLSNPKKLRLNLLTFLLSVNDINNSTQFVSTNKDDSLDVKDQIIWSILTKTNDIISKFMVYFFSYFIKN